MIVDFSVIKIYGFGSSLTALIQFSDNNQLEVTEGQLIEDHYKVDLITKNKVELLDLNTTKKIIVPFI